MLKEQYFAAINNYATERGTPVSAVEAWLDEHPEKRVENQENGGIGCSTKSVVFVDQLKGKPRAKRAKKQK